jgi:hypothetical protein
VDSGGGWLGEPHAIREDTHASAVRSAPSPRDCRETYVMLALLLWPRRGSFSRARRARIMLPMAATAIRCSFSAQVVAAVVGMPRALRVGVRYLVMVPVWPSEMMVLVVACEFLSGPRVPPPISHH